MGKKKEVTTVKIKWLEFENLCTGLVINKIFFNEDITLLVGLSGVGKTQILNAIEYSLKLAVNKSMPLKPFHVSLGLEVNEQEFVWEYYIKTEQMQEIVSEGEEEYYFSFEKFYANNEVLFERNEENVSVIGYEKIPKPKKDESLLVQYAQDERFKDVIAEIRKLYPIEIEIDVRRGLDKNEFNSLKARINEILRKDKNTPFRIFSHLPIAMKLYIIKRFYKDIYYKIFDAVKELFMEIQDIDVIESQEIEMYLICIEVYGNKLMQHEISNGMLKTIYYIVELYTMSENSLVLIDEFENGLGVNCIDILSEMLLNERRDLQFVITSHHPKIINGITKEKWKIIDRDVSVIRNTSSLEYGIGNSQHDAYFNLINKWEYEGKI